MHLSLLRENIKKKLICKLFLYIYIYKYKSKKYLLLKVRDLSNIFLVKLILTKDNK